MSEADAISKTAQPATVASLRTDFAKMGLTPGMTVMVHSSLSQLGFVVSGAQSVVMALRDTVGNDGTLMMPTHSGALSDPASWENPPVPESWWQELRDEMPAFDPALTPTRGMGAIAECFRHVPGVQRSNHPTVSAAAIGPNAAALLDGHELHDGLGESSPQARLYDLDGHVLLLGVDHGNNTSLHLSEYRAGLDIERQEGGAPIRVDGERVWATVTSLEDDESDFAQIGDAFVATGSETQAPVGSGVARFMRSRDIVDFGVTWMQQHRAAT